MPRAYSQDLRDRVLDGVLKEGISRRKAAHRYQVSEASATRWLQRYERTGARGAAKERGHRPSKVKPERAWLLATMEATPDLTLVEISKRLEAERGMRAAPSILSRFFKKEGWSFKKKAFCQASRTGIR